MSAIQPSFFDFDKEELSTHFKDMGLESFRLKQVWSWVYRHGAGDFACMTNLSSSLRDKLSQALSLKRPDIATHQVAQDGVHKWLLRMADGREVETVYIPETDRGTLCVSSQVGCTLNCTFCHTGTQLMVRNLTAGEIVSQIVVARDTLEDWTHLPSAPRRITNVVFMGMGEPLYNVDNVVQATACISDGDGLGISKRRITISTAGVVPKMEACGRRSGVNLAVSLHAPNDEIRTQIMPINKAWPLKELLEAIRNWPGLSNARRVTIEYVMLKGINDSPEQAHELVSLLRGIPAKVNLIPFNPWPGSTHVRSDNTTISKFANIVFKAGISCPVRVPRGEDILAACGQLRSESQKKNKSGSIAA